MAISIPLCRAFTCGARKGFWHFGEAKLADKETQNPQIGCECRTDLDLRMVHVSQTRPARRCKLQVVYVLAILVFAAVYFLCAEVLVFTPDEISAMTTLPAIANSMPTFPTVQDKLDFLGKLLDVTGADVGDGCHEIEIHFNGWIRQFDCHLSRYFQRHSISQAELVAFPFGDEGIVVDPRGAPGEGTMRKVTGETAHIPHTLLPGPDGRMLQFYGWRLDVMAYELFFSFPKPLAHGVFVEFGAEDGVKVSNTLFFEKYLKWTGILIEPSSSCCNKLSRYRTNSVIECHAVCEDGGTLTEMFSCDGGKDPPATCQPLRAMLSKNNIKHIDFLSVDCEGCELDALKTIDWEMTTVNVIVMEWRPEDGTKRSEFMKQLGYESARVPLYEVERVGNVTDEFFWHKERVTPFLGNAQ